MLIIKRQKLINISVLIIALIALALGSYFYYQLHTIKNLAETNTKQEVKSLVEKVGRLYLIPSNEEPTIATVSDPSILKDQSFFTLSEKGDKVLIFNKAGKAVLYRPDIDKIIEIAPIKSNPLTY